MSDMNSLSQKSDSNSVPKYPGVSTKTATFVFSMSRHKSGFEDIFGCCLFPLEYDFKNVCSCNECSSNIAKLKEFELHLKSKSKQVSECVNKLNKAKDNCFYLAAASGWSVDMLDVLLHNLKVVHVKLGLDFTTLGKIKSEMNDTDKKIQRMVTDQGFFLGINDVDDPDDTISHPSKTIYQKISCGLHRYNKTKVKEEAHLILHEVSRLEKLHEGAQVSKSAEEKEETLEVSKTYIEQQIELVRRLPVKKLIPEVEDEIDKVSHITRNTKKLVEARSCIIDNVSTYMVETRRLFWEEYEEKHKGVIGHETTGLKDTLQKLRDKADLFNAWWTEDFEHWVAPYERSDQKGNGRNKKSQIFQVYVSKSV